MNITYKDFSGGLNYWLSKLEAGSSMEKIIWDDAVNVRLYQNKGIISMSGNTQIGSSLGHSIQGVKGLKVNLNEYLLAVANGTLYQLSGTTWNSIPLAPTVINATSDPSISLSTSGKVTMTAYGQGCIISDGTNEPFIYFPERSQANLGTVTVTSGSNTITGTNLYKIIEAGDLIFINNELHIVSTATSSSVTTRDNFKNTYTGTNAYLTKVSYLNCNNIYLDFTADGVPTGTQVNIRGLAICQVGSRVFIGNSDGYYFSASGTYNDWQSQYDAGYSYDLGKTITCISNFRNYVIFYHGVNFGASLLNTNGQDYPVLINGETTTYLWQVYKSYFDKGTSSPWGALTVELQHYFFDLGAFTLDPTLYGTLMLGNEISLNIRDRQLGLLKGFYDSSRANEIIVIHNINYKELWFYIPVVGETEFNSVWIYDYLNQCWFRRKITQNVTCATTYQNNIFVGTDQGLILQEELGSSFNGSNITGYFNSQWFNFNSNREKEIDEFNLICDTFTPTNITYSLRKDYNPDILYDTYTISATNSSTLVWNVGKWNQANWSTVQITSETEELYGANQSFSLVFEFTSPQTMCISGFEMRNISIDQ